MSRFLPCRRSTTVYRFGLVMIFSSLSGSLWFPGQWFLSKRTLSDSRRGVLWGVIALEVLLAACRCAARLWGRVLLALAGLGRMKANSEVLPVARVRASEQGRTTWSSKSIWEPIRRWSSAFLPLNVFCERIRSFTCVLVRAMLQSCTKWEQSIISQEV